MGYMQLSRKERHTDRQTDRQTDMLSQMHTQMHTYVCVYHTIQASLALAIHEDFLVITVTYACVFIHPSIVCV